MGKGKAAAAAIRDAFPRERVKASAWYTKLGVNGKTKSYQKGHFVQENVSC